MSTSDAQHARVKTEPAPVEPRLVLAFQCHRPLAEPLSLSLAGVDQVALGRAGEMQLEKRGGCLSVGVPDDCMSATQARLTRALGSFFLEDAGSQNCTRVNGKPIERHSLADGDVLEIGRTIWLFRAGSSTTALPFAASEQRPEALRTLVPRFDHDLERLAELAASNVPILIEGEPGAGKELAARAVHSMSGRPGAFVAVNCGAIADATIESELFGYVKGAFTGARKDRVGLVQSADAGTLFLDEIADLTHGGQGALLRVLQEQEVQPVGGARPIPIDVRVLAATHQDVDELVRRGSFRKDLFARVAGSRVTLPPLRERREDLGSLIAVLLRRIAGERAKAISFDLQAARALFGYDWPENVRELEDCLATAVVFARSGQIAFEHLPETVRGERRAKPAVEDVKDAAKPYSADELSHRAEIIGWLEELDGNVSAVSRALGKDRKQVQRWLKRYALDPSDYR